MINVPRDEQEAIRAIDARAPETAIKACLNSRLVSSSLRASSGPYVSAKLRTFQAALVGYADAKAQKKLDQTYRHTLVTGSALADAVQQMQRRIDEQEQEG